MSKNTKTERLFVLYNTKEVGIITKEDDNTLSFEYSTSWLSDKSFFELSPALPLNYQGPFDNRRTRAFFENLLPEGHAKDKINQSCKDIASDSFRFLKNFGEDCAGAFIITPHSNYQEKINPKRTREILISQLDRAIDDHLSTAIYPSINSKFAFGFGKPGQKQFRWFNLREHHLQNTSKELSIHQHLLKNTLKRVILILEKKCKRYTLRQSPRLVRGGFLIKLIKRS